MQYETAVSSGMKMYECGTPCTIEWCFIQFTISVGYVDSKLDGIFQVESKIFS